jgi:hypothetical protein
MWIWAEFTPQRSSPFSIVCVEHFNDLLGFDAAKPIAAHTWDN